MCSQTKFLQDLFSDIEVYLFYDFHRHIATRHECTVESTHRGITVDPVFIAMLIMSRRIVAIIRKGRIRISNIINEKIRLYLTKLT